MEMITKPEVQEIPKPEHNTYKEIKPETDISVNEAKNFIDNKFNEMSANETTQYFDDNGNLYRVGNELLPDTEYSLNSYEYKTDSEGRIASVEGQLHMKTHEGRLTIRDSLEVIGKGDEKATDNRGHLIGDQFDGANGLENMIPQDAKINQNEYRSLENQLASEVKAGKDVRVNIEPVYDENSHRPDALVVSYSIDGEENMQIFPNGRE